MSRRRGVLLAAWLATAGPGPALAVAGSAEPAEATRLGALAPDLRPMVLERALAAFACALGESALRTGALAVIDYSLPSTVPRLWVFDRGAPRLLFHSLVAHGSGSGENFAVRFSNRHGSRQSSLGLFRAAEPYHGRNGYSLRLDGLDEGVNDQARARAIVLHGAWYVSPEFALRHGRLGRSWGCPAVEPGSVRAIIDSLRDGGLLFASAEDPEWLDRVALRRCGAQG